LLRTLHISPKIRIHCWGGLGSQVFAFIFLRQIQDRFPNRKVQIVFHNSGVTKRELELPLSLLRNIEYTQVNDFSISQKNIKKILSEFEPRNLLRTIVKVVSVKFGILFNDDEKLFPIRIKPWTVSIRCSYNNLTLRTKDLVIVSEIFGLETGPLTTASPCIAIHFRLGDLKNLATKTHIDPNSLNAVLREIQEPQLPLRIFSDSSPSEVSEVFSPSLNSSLQESHSLNPIQTVQECVKARVFVGTNSKISLWIAVLRCALLVDGDSYLPLQLAHTVKQLVQDLKCSSLLTAYYTSNDNSQLTKIENFAIGSRS